ncbi:MAG: SCO family protein [Acidobacteriota bacterium]
MTAETRSPEARTLRRLLWVLWALGMAALVVGVLWFRSQKAETLVAEPPLPVLKEAPSFALTNRDGGEVTLDTLAGRPWIADFVFTRCPGVCPILTQRMSELAADLPADGVRFVSFSVDPTHDTPEVLQAYAEKHGAGDNWLFLTGAEAEMYPLIREGFLLVLDPTPRVEEGQEPIVHSNRFVLVDGENRIRGYYNAFDAKELEQLKLDLARL